MTDPTPTPQPPPQGLTDEQLDALERQHWEATGVVSEAMQEEELFNYRAYARAAIAADRAARPQPTHEVVEARFRAPVGPHAVLSHVAFALHLLAGEVA